ncbi:protein transporter tim9 [Gnomoniopsis sp. IMI 355080]|uniref:Mitochondrial import inner membrane translocase subunit n=1 Tax=Gnomoniopsis smithogilvyi TaxID=1191159 RepID=A0A9W8YTV7_9PEZI|nr:protein transporter tim9 [Gnomoniopsis smithogilvyi]KAJ4425064.1 protein transporter tim9 [Gnomoniopsis sp. IMI 355080]
MDQVLGGLSQAEQRELEQRMQKRQVKEFVGLFGNLVDHCFSSCVNDFTSKAVTERENGCVTRCVQKYMSTGQRLAERFQEHNADMATKMGQR